MMDERILQMPALLVMHGLIVDRFAGMLGVTQQGFRKIELALAAT